MSVKTVVTYTGNLYCHALHPDSGVTMKTAAPVDNQGDGSSFSPTDLVGVSMASCMLTIMGIVARRDGIAIEGTTAETEKHMVADPQRRIGKLVCRFTLPADISEEQLDKLRLAAETCPVKRSLSDRTEVVIELNRKPM